MSCARVGSSSVTKLSGSLEKASCIPVTQLLGRTGVVTWLWWRGGIGRPGTRTEAEERQEMSGTRLGPGLAVMMRLAGR